MDNFYNIITKVCTELDINVTFLSEGWLMVLKKDNQIHYINGYKFDLNNHGIGNVLDDKGLFYDVMSYMNLPTIERVSIYQTYDKESVLEYFKKNNNTLIVKGNIGTCGDSVYLVKNEKELYDKMDMLLLKQTSISLEPYYDIINEYRVILLNNDAKIVYGKEKPTIIGDGIHTIKELAINFNEYFLENPIIVENLEYIPAKGEVIELNFKFNLSTGARMFNEIDEVLKNKIIDIAELVTKTLGIPFASIDIIYTRDNRLLVLEANSGVMMDNYIKQSPNGYDNAYKVYKEAIKLMFNIK